MRGNLRCTKIRRRKAAPGIAIKQLETDLKNLGYDLTVSNSSTAGEIVVISSDFNDTDHRVRFLAAMRGRNLPTAEACYAGFTTVRLKSSSLPIGFSESHSLDCSK